jgi:heme exporter protein A
VDASVEHGAETRVPAIAVRGLTKSFGSHAALKGVDLRIEPGESVVIFGPNGAGKTTLIKILATIMNPSSGEVLIDGMSTKDNAENIRRRIGVITHQTFLYSNLTAYENLNFYCRLYDVPSSDSRIKDVAATVEMTSRLNDRVSTLSRGMQQRLSIARALLHQPSILLLDEPETGLDQQAVTILRESMKSDRNRKSSIVLTTHNLERGLELSDRLLILSRGKIVYEKATKALDLPGLKEAYRQCTGC